MNKLFQQCWEVARQIVEAEKRLWPSCEDAKGFDFGGGSSTQDTNFARKGTSTNTINYQLPAFLTDLITGNANTAKNDASLATVQSGLLSSLMGKDASSLANTSVLTDNMAIAPTSFTGSSNLAQIAARDPFSSQFENDTQTAYEQRASDAMSQVATGPDAVRGGNARTAIGQGVMADRLAQGRGQEVRNAQLQDAGLASAASQMFGALENARRGVQLGAQGQKEGQILQQDQNALGAAKSLDNRKVSNLASLQLASDMLGTKKGINSDDLTGSGQQTNDSFNWGVNVLGGCCFIFLQALNGQLPWYIEKARHDYYTGYRRHGYKWMSNWLVPWMARSSRVGKVVNTLIINPFLKYGRWLYSDKVCCGSDVLWGPWCEGWLIIWSVLGALFCKKEVD